MAVGAAPSTPASGARERLLLRPLLPAGAPLEPDRYVEALGLWERPDGPQPRPRILLNMVSTVDGHATLRGRSGPISSVIDRAMFHALRAPADAVMAGAGTIRTERYGRLIRSPETRALRGHRGLSPEPLAVVVTASLNIDPTVPLLAEEESRLVLLTPSERELEGARASVSYVRCERNGQLDLAAAMQELHDRFGVRLLLCEGGPHLACELAAASLLDELFLCLSPRLGGGDRGAHAALRILAGPELEPPVELALLNALESDAQLFLRYGVVAPERVSWETIVSSSLAS
jgi:riboflavin biosynthesis pyrimidine reductase